MVTVPTARKPCRVDQSQLTALGDGQKRLQVCVQWTLGEFQFPAVEIGSAREQLIVGVVRP